MIGTVVAVVVAAAVGATLAVAAAVTMVNVVGGPTPQEVAEQRAGQLVSAEDLAYGNN
jgi:Na+-transporting methylmalonyl-CoA/oxaloacetate decarboxylase beta subunit